MPNQLVTDQTGVEIPQEWKNALNEVRENFPDAIIAGGALRDLYCNKEIKDLDFFAHPTQSEMPIMWSGSDMDYDGMQYVLAVCSRHDKSPPQNLIIYDNAPSTAALLESFDFGICQIGYDGYNILVTSAFFGTLSTVCLPCAILIV